MTKNAVPTDKAMNKLYINLDICYPVFRYDVIYRLVTGNPGLLFRNINQVMFDRRPGTNKSGLYTILLLLIYNDCFRLNTSFYNIMLKHVRKRILLFRNLFDRLGC